MNDTRMDTTLRRSIPADARALAEIHVAAWRQAYRKIVPDSYLEKFTVESRTKRFREFLAVNTAETYVAEQGGRIIGFLTLGGARDTDEEPGNTGEIWGIYVSPELWRRGVGRYLCEQGQNLLASRDFAIATLWVLEANSRARSFYEAMGFQPDGATKQLPLGIPLAAIRYRKHLS
jgi:ribosomal protein S18 acetylase RimI-like enzyme